MKCWVSEGEEINWDLKLRKIERYVNSSVSAATGKTPYEALYGYLLRFEDFRTRDVTQRGNRYPLPVEVQDEIRDNIEKA